MTQFSKTFSVSLFVACLGFGAAVAQSPDSSMPAKTSAGFTAADSTFVKKAASGGLAEVELGQLAVQKASSPEVKQFGQRMVDDHTKANNELKEVAAQDHIVLPQSMSAKDKATKASLEQLSGDQFDRAYMEDMVKDHKKDVAEFERESKTAMDPAVKSFAQQTLPTLRDHLKQAEKIAPGQQAANSMR